jgi:hypothetical protein
MGGWTGAIGKIVWGIITRIRIIEGVSRLLWKIK